MSSAGKPPKLLGSGRSSSTRVDKEVQDDIERIISFRDLRCRIERAIEKEEEVTCELHYHAFMDPLVGDEEEKFITRYCDSVKRGERLNEMLENVNGELRKLGVIQLAMEISSAKN